MEQVLTWMIDKVLDYIGLLRTWQLIGIPLLYWLGAFIILSILVNAFVERQG